MVRYTIKVKYIQCIKLLLMFGGHKKIIVNDL